MEKSLTGIKVIQLANFVAAAATGRYLADHGADVIIIEAKQGDALRFTEEQEGRPQDMYENTTNLEFLKNLFPAKVNLGIKRTVIY